MKVAGFGFRAAATVDSLRTALAATNHADLTAIATPADKASAPAFQQLAQELGLMILPIEPAAMQAADTITQSAKVREKRGTGSVAEACALVAAGPNATLLTPRHISHDRLATCAISQGAAL